MLVKNFMTANPRVVSPEDNIKVVFNELLDSHIRQAPVIENDNLIGIITDRDIRMALVSEKPKMDLNVKNVMIPNPVTIEENMSIKDAANILIEKKYNALPVVNNENQLTGILTTTDIIKGFIESSD